MITPSQTFGALIVAAGALCGTAGAQDVKPYNPYDDAILVRKECLRLADWLRVGNTYFYVVTCPSNRAGINVWGDVVDRRTGVLDGSVGGSFRLGSEFPVSMRGLYAGHFVVPFNSSRAFYAVKLQVSCTAHFPK